MGKQLSPLEKEFLIKTYRAKTEVKLSDFCEMNDVSETSMRKWIKQYEAGGIEGLSRAGEMGDVLPEGIDRTEENVGRDRQALEELAVDERAVFVFTSASTVRGTVDDMSPEALARMQAVCIGEQTAQEARQYGIAVQVARQADEESLVAAVVERAADRKKE